MRFLRLALLVTLLAGTGLAALPAPALAEAPPLNGCTEGTFNTGAHWLICMLPANWNGDLLVYAHGYTSVTEPLGFQTSLPDGTDLASLVTGLGYAFAATTYRTNGLAILDGVQDVKQVAVHFASVAHQAPKHIYLAGVSEGGLVTTLGVEKFPDIFSGGLAACGPIGDFQWQTNHFGNFRVLYDYFYPGILPNTPPYSAINVPEYFMTNWENFYKDAIGATLANNTDNAAQLIATSQAAVDPLVPATAIPTAQDILWYSAFATNDATAKLGGNPFENSQTVYVDPLASPAGNAALNTGVARFTESPEAARNMRKYQTSGQLTRPLVTLHNLYDPVVPVQHELFYLAKAQASGTTGLLTQIPVPRYGHCNFTGGEILAAFGLLVQQVTGQMPAGLPMQFNFEQAKSDFAHLQQETALPR